MKKSVLLSALLLTTISLNYNQQITHATDSDFQTETIKPKSTSESKSDNKTKTELSENKSEKKSSKKSSDNKSDKINNSSNSDNNTDTDKNSSSERIPEFPVWNKKILVGNTVKLTKADRKLILKEYQKQYKIYKSKKVSVDEYGNILYAAKNTEPRIVVAAANVVSAFPALPPAITVNQVPIAKSVKSDLLKELKELNPTTAKISVDKYGGAKFVFSATNVVSVGQNVLINIDNSSVYRRERERNKAVTKSDSNNNNSNASVNKSELNNNHNSDNKSDDENNSANTDNKSAKTKSTKSKSDKKVAKKKNKKKSDKNTEVDKNANSDNESVLEKWLDKLSGRKSDNNKNNDTDKNTENNNVKSAADKKTDILNILLIGLILILVAALGVVINLAVNQYKKYNWRMTLNKKQKRKQ